MSPPERGVQWVLIGPTSRHVYARKLSDLLQVPHISMASLLQQDLNPTSSLYKQIAHAVNKGGLVPEDIVFGLLSKRLEDGYYEGETGFILDGFPRTKTQAEILDKLVEVDLVVNFKGAKDSLLEHSKDGYFSSFATPDKQNLGEQSKYPVINSGSTWTEKAQSYARQVRLLEDYYKKQKKLIDFQVCNAPGETWQGLLAALQLQHIDDAHCGPKLP